MKLNLESSSYSFELDETDSPATLGRAEECKCVITEGNVSRKHAEVRYEKNSWSVIDIGSRAGTLVNGKKIEGAKVLGDGDVLRLGDQSFVISLTDSNDMEALGARLAGGKVKQLIKTAAAKPKKAEEKKPTPKKSEEKAEKPAESEKAETENESSGEAEGEESPKAAKKSMRKPAPRKQKSSLAGLLTTLVLMALLGAGGYFGWQYHQQQQQNKAAASGAGTGDAATVKLPPKENAVALPAKETATTVVSPDAAPDATKPPEEKAPEPASKAPEAPPAPDAKAPEAAPEAPKTEKPAETPAADK